MAENLSYKPEDVIEHDGSNKGNISDKKLAEVGAEAEKSTRGWSERKKRREFNNNQLEDYGAVASSPEELQAMVADNQGKIAMKQEVFRRSYEESIGRGVSPAAAKERAEEAAEEYFKAQLELTRERVEEEKRA